jgi:hypothetical protein
VEASGDERGTTDGKRRPFLRPALNNNIRAFRLHGKVQAPRFQLIFADELKARGLRLNRIVV